MKTAKGTRNLDFMANLATAAGKSFADSAAEWRVDGIYFSGAELHCHACNTAINHYAVLRAENAGRIIIGLTCYDKLLRYLGTGVVCSLKTSSFHIRDMKRRSVAILSETVRAWFGEQLGKTGFPPELISALRQFDVVGYVPTGEIADQLAEYYRTHRQFFTEKLVPEVRSSRHRRMFPGHITSAQADQVRSLLAREKEFDQGEKGRREQVDGLRRSLYSSLRKVMACVHNSSLPRSFPIVEEFLVLSDELARVIKLGSGRSFLAEAPYWITYADEWIENYSYLLFEHVVVERMESGEIRLVSTLTGPHARVSGLYLIGHNELTSRGFYPAYRDSFRSRLLIEPYPLSFTEVVSIVSVSA